MASLATVYDFISYYGLSSYDSTSIQSQLDYSTALISTYCNREFEKQDYIEWLDSGDGMVKTSEYPINRLYFVKAVKTVATLTTSNTATEQIFEKTDDDIYLTLDNVTTNYPLSTYTTIGSLSSDMILSGIDVTLSDIATTYPTIYLQNVTTDLDDCYLIGGDIKNLKASIDKHSNRIINVDQYGDILTKYNAGYTFSVDLSGHNGYQVVGNVPNDLKQVAISLAHDISLIVDASYNAGGTTTSLFKSETIGDYSYERYSNYSAQYLLNKYTTNEDGTFASDSVLNFYRKKSF